jgi:hypothetical protein
MGVDDVEALHAVLAAFANLADSQKIMVREVISGNKLSASRDTSDAKPGSRSTEVAPNVHSCHICRELVISRRETPEYTGQIVDGNFWAFRTSTIRLDTSLLARKRSRTCLIVQWIFELLTHSLFDLKKELSEKGGHEAVPLYTQEIEDATQDLEYIHPKGIEVRTYFRSDDASGWIEFAFDANPHLLDRLFGYSAGSQPASKDYYGFVTRHQVRKKLKARAFTTTSKFTDSSCPKCFHAIIIPIYSSTLLLELSKSSSRWGMNDH